MKGWRGRDERGGEGEGKGEGEGGMGGGAKHYQHMTSGSDGSTS